MGRVSYCLRFPFLRRYGKIFCVFDRNDSGNVSFGVASKTGERFFIKIAGARTKHSCITPAEAIANLRQAIPLYEEMRHPNLIELVEHFAHGTYYAAVFRWQEGDCLWDFWNWSRYAKTGQPRPFERFRALPLEKRMKAFETVLSFFETIEAAGYVSVDFYLGTVMYDFQTDAISFCDIDLFRKQPCVNDMGRMWGQSRFMAPEEFRLDAALDERTNVYRLGATALILLGEKELLTALRSITKKATSPAPEDRHASVAAFAAAWRASS